MKLTLTELITGAVVTGVTLLVLTACFKSEEAPPPNEALSTVALKARMQQDLSQVSQILKMCKLHAMDWEGGFPLLDPDSTSDELFKTSTEAFNHLMETVEIHDEAVFYVRGNPDKLAKPNGDGFLEKRENSYVYVTGQSDSFSAVSPLIADEMASPGVYGSKHPWLRQGKAVVGTVGGAVKLMDLSKTSPGATVVGPPRSGIDDIFQEAQVDEEGRITGGWLAVDRSNILLP